MSLTQLLGLACLVAMVVTCAASALVSDDVSQQNGTGGSNVAFSAYLDGNIRMSESILIFDKEIYDEGNNYNTDTGIFTAPENGTYLFYFQIEHWVSVRRQVAHLYVGSDIKASCVIHPNGASTQSSAMVTLPLTSDQTVHVRVNTGDVYGTSDERFTSFTGARLF